MGVSFLFRLKFSADNYRYVICDSSDNILGTANDINKYASIAVRMANKSYGDVILSVAETVHDIQENYGKNNNIEMEAEDTIKTLIRYQMDILKNDNVSANLDTININKAQDILRATRQAIKDVNDIS